MFQYIKQMVVYAFDFDLTLTDAHSGGYPTEDDEDTDERFIAWNSPEKKEELTEMLQNIQTQGNSIYIVSRGLKDQIIEFLDMEGLLPFFKHVYGAKDEDQLAVGTLSGVYSEKDEEECSSNWARLKSRMLHEIAVDEQCSSRDIIFLDDTQGNVEEAKRNNFSAYYVFPAGLTTTLNIVHNLLNRVSREPRRRSPSVKTSWKKTKSSIKKARSAPPSTKKKITKSTLPRKSW